MIKYILSNYSRNIGKQNEFALKLKEYFRTHNEIFIVSNNPTSIIKNLKKLDVNVKSEPVYRYTESNFIIRMIENNYEKEICGYKLIKI